jgi:hypothetical protein
LGNAFSQTTMTFNFEGWILVVGRTREERGGRQRSGFRDKFAALGAGILVAPELLMLFRREFANRRQGCEFSKSIVL